MSPSLTRINEPSTRNQRYRQESVKCRSAVVESAVFVPDWRPHFEADYDLSAAEVPSSAVLPAFLLLGQASPAVPSAVAKVLDGSPGLGQQRRMFHRPFHFVRDAAALHDVLFPSNSSAAPAAAKARR